MNQQTAVEWLVEQLEQHHVKIDIKNTVVYQQAKEMEKEQILRSMGIAFNDALEIQAGKKSPYKDWEQFYNETYGGEQ